VGIHPATLPALRDTPASLAAFPRRSVGVFIASYLKLMRMGHMLFVPDIFALERENGIEKKSLDILILTVECWATKRCCTTLYLYQVQYCKSAT